MNITKEIILLSVAVSKTIDYLDLDKRAWTALRRNGVNTIAELCEAMQSGRIKKFRGIGQKSIWEIEYRLGIYLERETMKIQEKGEQE